VMSWGWGLSIPFIDPTVPRRKRHSKLPWLSY
jgi:hypothetical protein